MHLRTIVEKQKEKANSQFTPLYNQLTHTCRPPYKLSDIGIFYSNNTTADMLTLCQASGGNVIESMVFNNTWSFPQANQITDLIHLWRRCAEDEHANIEWGNHPSSWWNEIKRKK